MIAIQRDKLKPYFIEISKWALVVLLLLPVYTARSGVVDFTRVALGIILFVIFAGKFLYDVVFFPKQHANESSPGKDLLSMLGIVVGIAFLVVAIVLFVAFFLVDYLKQVRL